MRVEVMRILLVTVENRWSKEEVEKVDRGGVGKKRCMCATLSLFAVSSFSFVTGLNLLHFFFVPTFD